MWYVIGIAVAMVFIMLMDNGEFTKITNPYWNVGTTLLLALIWPVPVVLWLMLVVKYYRNRRRK